MNDQAESLRRLVRARELWERMNAEPPPRPQGATGGLGERESPEGGASPRADPRRKAG